MKTSEPGGLPEYIEEILERIYCYPCYKADRDVDDGDIVGLMDVRAAIQSAIDEAYQRGRTDLVKAHRGGIDGD